MEDAPANAQFRPRGDLDVGEAFSPYAGPWNPRLAAHLLRRAGFGGSPADIAAAAAEGMEAAVNRLLHPQPDALPPAPDADLTYGPGVDPAQRRAAFLAAVTWWLDRMLRTPNPLVERMVYFWHNHFTSAIDGPITPGLMVAQNALFRRSALGDFGELAHAISRDPAMLLYLNGSQNRKQHPNENYARELMELFTLGVGNYTEADVRESARAFTGWTVRPGTGEAVFVERFHDDGEKTFLGRSGDFGADDIVDIILQQPDAARFVAAKSLRAFVYDDPEPALVDALATRFRASGYDAGALMGVVLRSNVFYSPRAYRALVKSPVEVVVGALRMLGVTSAPPRVVGAMAAMDQILMHPPNVAGWPGGAQWLNSGTILARLNFLNQLASFHPAPAVAGGATPDPLAAMPTTTGPAAWLQDVDIADPGSVAEAILAMAVQDDATEEQRRSVMVYLQSDGVGNPVALSGENIDEKARGALSLALALPAYQLA